MPQQYIPFHVIEKHVIQAVQERGLHHLDVRVAFKDEEENDNAHPDEHKHAENSFSACIYYKKVKERMQYNGNEQAEGR